MSIYAIGDLHLSHQVEKPMDIFGDGWVNHTEQIRENWINTVGEEDTVLLPGDFSWATYLDQAVEDFAFLNDLPGRKIMLKGNHDYWWETVTKMKKFLEEKGFINIDFLYNNCIVAEGRCLVGTKGYDFENEGDPVIINREHVRFGLSIDSCRVDSFVKTAVFHFPPDRNPEFIRLMKGAGIGQCIFGHIHGPWDRPNEFMKDGIRYINVSADRIGFTPVLI